MAKKKIYISYEYDNDKHFKNLLSAWDAHSGINFGFSDQSTDIDIKSTDAVAIKRVISRRIKSAPYFLCIIGRKTHKSDWVKWEIEKAIELKKKIIAVKINPSHTSPDEILNVGTSWAKTFTFNAIKKAIEEV